MMWLLVTQQLTSTITKLGPFKYVYVNCFCASLLRTQIHMTRHSSSALSTKMKKINVRKVSRKRH